MSETLAREYAARTVTALSIVCLVVACDSFEIRERSQGWDSFSGIQTENDQPRPLAFVKSIRLTINGTERNLNPEFIRRVRDNLWETNLFHEVVFEKPAQTYPHVELSLSVSDVFQQDVALNFVKTMLTAVTLFMLAPVLTQYAEQTSEMHLKAVRSDGRATEYHARSSGVAKAALDIRKQMVDLASRVSANNLNSLMSQMIGDADFYRLPRPKPGTTS